MATSRTPAYSMRHGGERRQSFGPVLVFSFLALCAALIPPVAFAADPVVDTQRNAVVVFIVIVLLVGSVAAGLFFASPLRKRFMPSPETEIWDRDVNGSGAGETHSWPAPGRSAPSYAMPATIHGPTRLVEEPAWRTQDHAPLTEVRPTYPPTQPAQPTQPTYQPQPKYLPQPTYQAPAMYVPPQAFHPPPTYQAPPPLAPPPMTPTPVQPQRQPQPPLQPQPIYRPAAATPPASARPQASPWSTTAPRPDPQWPPRRPGPQ
ncbi:MAG: hypothetical protein ABIP53_09230 [Candidatus Limnocylindrales bacterium]